MPSRHDLLRAIRQAHRDEYQALEARFLEQPWLKKRPLWRSRAIDADRGWCAYRPTPWLHLKQSEQATVTRMLKTLVRDQLVEVDAPRGRVVGIRLTDSGKQLLEQLDRPIEQEGHEHVTSGR